MVIRLLLAWVLCSFSTQAIAAPKCSEELKSRIRRSTVRAVVTRAILIPMMINPATVLAFGPIFPIKTRRNVPDHFLYKGYNNPSEHYASVLKAATHFIHEKSSRTERDQALTVLLPYFQDIIGRHPTSNMRFDEMVTFLDDLNQFEFRESRHFCEALKASAKVSLEHLDHSIGSHWEKLKELKADLEKHYLENNGYAGSCEMEQYPSEYMRVMIADILFPNGVPAPFTNFRHAI